MSNGRLGARMRTQTKTGYYKNAFLVFDFRDLNNYKFAGMRDGSDDWSLGQVEDGSVFYRAQWFSPITTGQWYDVEVQLVGNTATLRVDGSVMGSHDYSPNGGIRSGPVGLRISRAHSDLNEVGIAAFTAPLRICSCKRVVSADGSTSSCSARARRQAWY